jgi:co-chaperonin GroES (HSP10)
MPLRLMDHGGVDPAEELRERIGFIEDFQVPLNQVLLGIYMMPEKTKSGLFLADDTREESKWQGKACLVLKMGPIAFQDDEKFSFHGFAPTVGDWVVVRPSDGMKIDINQPKGHCMLVSDTQIKMIIPSPDAVW